MSREPVELVIINDWFDHINDECKAVSLKGKSVYELLRQHYPDHKPSNTVFYKGSLTAKNIIPDTTYDEVDYLYQQTGRIYAVTYPADPISVGIAIVVGIGTAVAVSLLMPKPQLAGTGGSQPPSPNNTLAQRGNRQRIGGAVANPFGENWLNPDLAAVTYSVYVDHDQVEFATMTPGIGTFDVTRARDDTTDFERIRGATAEFYNPGQDVRFDTPVKRFGNAMTTDEQKYAYLVAKRYDAVNGQVLPPPDNYLTLDQISFNNPNIIESSNNSIDFSKQFNAGDTISIEQADELMSGNNLTITDEDGTTETPVVYNLSGNYVIESIDEFQIRLLTPSQINTDWQKITDNIDFTQEAEIVLSTESQALWSDYFYTSGNEHTDVLYNIIAPNGLYNTGGDKWEPIGVDFEVESQVVDKNGVPVEGTLYSKNEVIKARSFAKYAKNNGAGERVRGYLHGDIASSDDDVRRTAATTYRIGNPYQKSGDNIRVRYRRTSKRITDKKWTVVQEIRIADLLGIRNLSHNNYDYDHNATMIITKQLGTAGALSFKERKFNCLAFRYVRNWRDNDALILSKRIDDIFYHNATDPDVANLTINDLDMPQISSEVDRGVDYFGTEQCFEFCYTFDKNNITDSEILATIANAGFCKAYDFGNKLRFYFEGATDVPVANFTAHNILPDSYQPSESFGTRNEHDGVVAKYREPVDDAEITLHIPEDQSAINADEVELVGVRNKTQAYMHAHRRNQKNKHARKTVQITALDESNIVIEGNRIAIADQYREGTQQGEVRNLETINGQIVLTTSDPVTIPDDANATLWIQTTARYVDNIGVSTGPKPNQLILARMPTSPISTDANAVVRATYEVAINNDASKSAYIVTDKTPEGYANQLVSINYDDRYYKFDKDHILGQLTWLIAS